MSKIGIIVNPHAKRNRKKSPVNAFKEIGGGYVDIRVTESLDNVTETAKDFKKQGVKYIAISGGDGTIHHVQSRFINVYKHEELPPFIVLRSGTMNTISRTINLKGDSFEILQKFITKIRAGVRPEIHYRDTINVNNKCCYLFGIGLCANFISQYNHGKYSGPSKAVYVILRGIFSGITGRSDVNLFKRVDARVLIDGKELWFNDICAIFATTVEEIGISFRPMRRALEKENTFHVIATGITPLELIPRLGKLRRGKTIDHPNHFDDIASKIIIHGPERYEYMMDGEIYEWSGELKIKTGPRVGLIYV